MSKPRKRKLTDRDVSKIRELIALDIPQCDIARRFGVGQTVVSAIKLGKVRFAVAT